MTDLEAPYCDVCDNSGDARVEGSNILINCPDCSRGDYTPAQEAIEDARDGK